MTTIMPIRRETRDMWDVAADLDRVFDAVGDVLPRAAVREGLWHPPISVFDRKDELVVELELPGVRREDVDMSIEENHLVVEGKRSRAEEFSSEDAYFDERWLGRFHRIVHLPADVDETAAKAKLSDGVLVIRLPKAKREGGKKIPLEVT